MFGENVAKAKRANSKSGRPVCSRVGRKTEAAELDSVTLVKEIVPVRRAPRPSGCQKFVRREIADALPQICAMLLTRTIQDGDLASLKLLMQMALETGGAEQSGSKRTTGFARKMLAGFRAWEARETELKRDC